MTVGLRYLGYDLAMPDGELILGRGPECRLCLNDPIVSRRHALIIVEGGAAMIEDLGSRNGVIVNKHRIEGRHLLADGDVIVIGAQELTFYVGEPRRPAEAERPTEARPELDAYPTGARPVDITTIGQSVIAVEERLLAFERVGQVALNALLRGRAAEAERILERPLAEVLSSSRCGLDVDAALAEFAARYATRLAEATRNSYWVDYVFDLYTIRQEALPPEIVGALAELAPRVTQVDVTTLKVYLARRAAAVAADPSLAEAHAGLVNLARALGLDR